MSPPGVSPEKTSSTISDLVEGAELLHVALLHLVQAVGHSLHVLPEDVAHVLQGDDPQTEGRPEGRTLLLSSPVAHLTRRHLVVEQDQLLADLPELVL